jgi:hypothetical protein
MRTLLVATAAFAALVICAPVGAHAAEGPNLPPPGRYFVNECVEVGSATAGAKWTLDVDRARHEVEFWPINHPEAWREGPLQLGQTTMTAVINTESGVRMNLALVDIYADATPLTWVQGWKSGKMTCYGITTSNDKPWGWHDVPPAALPHV